MAPANSASKGAARDHPAKPNGKPSVETWPSISFQPELSKRDFSALRKQHESGRYVGTAALSTFALWPIYSSAQPRAGRRRLDLPLRGRARLVGCGASLGSLMKFSGWSRLSTEISSSISSQWMPMPPPISSQSDRSRASRRPTAGTRPGAQTRRARPTTSRTARRSSTTPRPPEPQFFRPKYSCHFYRKNLPFCTTICRISVISCPRKPLTSATETGSSQNFA